MKNSIDMLTGSTLDKILIFALPLAMSSILQQLFNSADIAVVGRFVGSQALAAVGSNGPIINLLINIFVGISVGANVIIGNLLGQKKQNECQVSVHTAITFSIISGFLLIFIGFFASRPLLVLMDTPEDVINLAVLYLRIYFSGMPFIMFYNFGAAILRSNGDTKRPLYALVISGITNVILNLIFVIGLNLGVMGVGIATVVSNAISASLIFYFLKKEGSFLRFSVKKMTISNLYLIRMAKIGIPAGIQAMVFSLSNIFVQASINTFGSSAMAGSAAAVNFEYLSYFIVSAFSQAAVSFSSQNYGAKKFDRCKKIFIQCLCCSLFFSFLLTFTFVFFRHKFIRIYTVDESAIFYALIRVTLVESFGCLPSTYEVASSALRAMGRSILPTVLTVLGSCVFRLLWLITIFRLFPTFETIMRVYPISWFITGCMVLTAYFVISKKTTNLQK